jgi:ferrous iron transport protein B
VFKKTWIRVKGFVYIAFPILVLGSGILGLLEGLAVLETITAPFQPIIGGWLLLPPVVGIALIYGILRKEMALSTLVVLAGSANLLAFMTPIQIYVFALVSAIYVPCVATIGILIREFGWKKSLLISASTVLIAVLLGGIVARLFPALGIL